MIAANSVSSGVSCVPPPCGRTFDGGISGSAISHSPSGTIQLHVPRPMHSPTSDHHIGHGLRTMSDDAAASRSRGRSAGGDRCASSFNRAEQRLSLRLPEDHPVVKAKWRLTQRGFGPLGGRARRGGDGAGRRRSLPGDVTPRRADGRCPGSGPACSRPSFTSMQRRVEVERNSHAPSVLPCVGPHHTRPGDGHPPIGCCGKRAGARDRGSDAVSSGPRCTPVGTT